ncbi:murein hydrolase activator EnvC family protein [Microbacterium aureliae]
MPVRHPLHLFAVVAAAALVLCSLVLCSAAPAPAAVAGPPSPRGTAAEARWAWPVEPFRLERPYVAPAHRYAAGHRGIDVRPLGATTVRAPAAGIVAFAGPVAGRDVVTLAHPGDLVTTLEPVASSVEPGDPVARGAIVGELSSGGHAADGTLHIGVRLAGEYINPLLLLGEIRPAVLLPCC